jgi:hypothetical protein
MQVLGGWLGGRSAKKAAAAQAEALRQAGNQAFESSRFRPVGITSRFGSSNFQVDPTTGALLGAGYELSPELASIQDRLFSQLGQGDLSGQALQQAQGLFGLGQQYLAQSPQEAAQQYMSRQQDLLAPSRERQYGELQNQLFQTGRGGLSVGATGERPSGAAGLGASNPETEAYYNARLPKIQIYKNKLLTIVNKDGKEESYLFTANALEDANNQRSVFQFSLVSEEANSDEDYDQPKNLTWRFFAIQNEVYLALNYAQLSRINSELQEAGSIEAFSEYYERVVMATDFDSDYRQTTTGNGVYLSRKKDTFMKESLYIDPSELIFLFKLK